MAKQDSCGSNTTLELPQWTVRRRQGEGGERRSSSGLSRELLVDRENLSMATAQVVLGPSDGSSS